MEDNVTPARGELFSLPAGPASLCFDKNEFMKKTFSVDEFLHENRNIKNVIKKKNEVIAAEKG